MTQLFTTGIFDSVKVSVILWQWKYSNTSNTNKCNLGYPGVIPHTTSTPGTIS